MSKVITTAVTINNISLPIREYDGKRVVTFSDIDQVHRRPGGTARKRFNDNRHRFRINDDYYKVKCDEVRPFFGQTLPNGFNPKGDLILITETGYLMLTKSLNDDLSWDVQRQLVNGYFKTKDSTIVTITPEIASEMLKHNVGNRKINQANVKRIAEDMLAGDYKLNGETIKIYEDGTLADGQHRLTACVLANVPFQTYIVRNIKKDVLPTIDCGKTRGLVESLNMIGCDVDRLILPAINYYFNYGNKLTANQVECLWNEYEEQFKFICDLLRSSHHDHIMSQRNFRAFCLHLLLSENWSEESVTSFVNGIKNKPDRDSNFEQTCYYFRVWYDKKVHNKLRDGGASGELNKSARTMDALMSVANSFREDKVIKVFPWKNRAKSVLDIGNKLARRSIIALNGNVTKALT